jgi:hypothetical protein
MSTKSPECYTTDANARCLRVEISASRSLLLSLDHFAFSELTSDGKEQRLRLVFVTHEVVISGFALRRIEAGMQRKELASLMKLPEKYQSLMNDNQPIIREIAVTESQSVNLQSEAHSN